MNSPQRLLPGTLSRTPARLACGGSCRARVCPALGLVREPPWTPPSDALSLKVALTTTHAGGKGAPLRMAFSRDSNPPFI